MKSIAYMQRVRTICGDFPSMEAIEQRLIRLLESGRPVTLEALGGIDDCYAAADIIASSPMMDEFLRAFVEYKAKSHTKAESEQVEYLVVKCFALNNDPIAIKNAVHLLCSWPQELGYTFDVLLKRAADDTNLSIIRGYLLLAAFEIAVRNKSRKFKLISYLIEIDVNEESDYLRYVSKITGVGYSSFQIEELAGKLVEYVDAQVGEDDALFELGMCFLTKAFNSRSQNQAIQNFDAALSYFVTANDYDRRDAGIYSSAILILKGFIDGAENNELQKHLQQFQKSLTMYVAWDNYARQISWVNLRETEIFYWFEMADYLTSLLGYFRSPAWLEPIIVIEDYLLRIYDCNRSIFKLDANGSLELLIRPIIHEHFIEQPMQVYLLEQWINLNRNPEIIPIAQNLRDEIEKFKSTSTPGKADGAALSLLTDAVPSVILLSPVARTEFEEFASAYRVDQTTNVSLILQKKFNELVVGLKSIESYNIPEIRKEFNSILFYTLKFLELRMDNTGANHLKAKYLFENKNLPLERVLQNDYFEYMEPLCLKGKCKVEQTDIAGGRVDVHFEFLSFSFCTEVKRELRDTSFEALRDKYLGQAKEYQNTTAKVGILLVLDLLPKPKGIGSLESNVKLEITSTASDPGLRGIVVVKVPGNRVTPSSIVI